MTSHAVSADLAQRLHLLGQDARALWLAGVSQHDILLHVVTGLGGWTRSDPNHLELLDALARVRDGVEGTTPP
jgi:hypothetical protein